MHNNVNSVTCPVISSVLFRCCPCSASFLSKMFPPSYLKWHNNIRSGHDVTEIARKHPKQSSIGQFLMTFVTPRNTTTFMHNGHLLGSTLSRPRPTIYFFFNFNIKGVT